MKKSILFLSVASNRWITTEIMFDPAQSPGRHHQNLLFRESLL